MTAYEWRMNDWSSYVCSSDLPRNGVEDRRFAESRHHADDMDARRPEKAEPGLQIGGLVIEAAQGAPGPRIQRTGRNDDRRPPRCMSDHIRSEEQTSELQSLMRISYAVFCLKKKQDTKTKNNTPH